MALISQTALTFGGQADLIMLELEEASEEPVLQPQYLDPGQNTPVFDSVDVHGSSQVEPDKLQEALMKIYNLLTTDYPGVVDTQTRYHELPSFDDSRSMMADESEFFLGTRMADIPRKFVDIREIEDLRDETSSDSSDEETLGRFYTSRSYAFEEFKLESDGVKENAFLYWAHASPSVENVGSWLPVEYIYNRDSAANDSYSRKPL